MGTINIGVAAFVPVPPVANAGPDQTFNLPTSTANLSGSGSSSDGTIVSYAWTQLSGPSGTIVNPSSSATPVSGMTTSGTYVFQLLVTDNYGLTDTDTLSVIVASLADIVINATLVENPSTFDFIVTLTSSIPASVDISVAFVGNFVEASVDTPVTGTLVILAGTLTISGHFGSYDGGSITERGVDSAVATPSTADGRNITFTF